jgi:Domain of unknown function (DUF4253)
MSLTESELREFLVCSNVDCQSLRLLWEIDNVSVYGLTVGGTEAINLWNYLRQLNDESHYYPLLLGGEEEIEKHQEYWERFAVPENEIIEIDAVSAVINRASTLDAEKWFCDRAQEMYADEFDEEVEDRDPLEAITNGILGDWNGDIFPSENFTIPALETVMIALIPTQICWHIPAYLNFGGWNSCPIPEEHICLMKKWYEIYGAEVVGMTHDTIEMRVIKPPLDEKTAMSLAKEQYLYCNDIVDQGTQTLSALVSTLIECSVWYFWWD